MNFIYTTSTGANVNLTISSLESIVVIVKKESANVNLTTECKSSFYYPNQLGRIVASLAFKKEADVNGMKITGIEINEEIKNYISKLKEEEKLSKMSPYEKASLLKVETYLPNIKKLAPDMSTGIIYCTFMRTVDYNDWKKVKHLFSYMDSKNEDTDFMDGSDFKGYVTTNPDEVCSILNPNWKEVYEAAVIEFKKLNDEKEALEADKKKQADIFIDTLTDSKELRTLLRENSDEFVDLMNKDNHNADNFPLTNLSLFSREKITNTILKDKILINNYDLYTYKNDNATELKLDPDKEYYIYEESTNGRRNYNYKGFTLGRKIGDKQVAYFIGDTNISKEWWQSGGNLFSIFAHGNMCDCNVYLLSSKEIIVLKKMFFYQERGRDFADSYIKVGYQKEALDSTYIGYEDNLLKRILEEKNVKYDEVRNFTYLENVIDKQSAKDNT